MDDVIQPATATHGTPPPLLAEAPPPPPTVAPPLSPAAQRFAVRMWSAFIFSICAAMLGVGLYLTPTTSPLQMGTHRQLGLPECGFLKVTGLPCPTCGCTTAVSHVAHGQFIAAFITQPFGAVVGLLGLAGVALGGFGLLTGRWIGPQPFTLAWYWRGLMISGAALLAGGWAYKIIMVKMTVGHELLRSL